MILFRRFWIRRQFLSNMTHKMILKIILNQSQVIRQLRIQCKLHIKVPTTILKIHIPKINITRKTTKAEAAKIPMEPSTRPTWLRRMYSITWRSLLGWKIPLSRKAIQTPTTTASSATTCLPNNE